MLDFRSLIGALLWEHPSRLAPPFVLQTLSAAIAASQAILLTSSRCLLVALSLLMQTSDTHFVFWQAVVHIVRSPRLHYCLYTTSIIFTTDCRLPAIFLRSASNPCQVCLLNHTHDGLAWRKALMLIILTRYLLEWSQRHHNTCSIQISQTTGPF